MFCHKLLEQEVIDKLINGDLRSLVFEFVLWRSSQTEVINRLLGSVFTVRVLRSGHVGSDWLSSRSDAERQYPSPLGWDRGRVDEQTVMGWTDGRGTLWSCSGGRRDWPTGRGRHVLNGGTWRTDRVRANQPMNRFVYRQWRFTNEMFSVKDISSP